MGSLNSEAPTQLRCTSACPPFPRLWRRRCCFSWRKFCVLLFATRNAIATAYESMLSLLMMVIHLETACPGPQAFFRSRRRCFSNSSGVIGVVSNDAYRCSFSFWNFFLQRYQRQADWIMVMIFARRSSRISSSRPRTPARKKICDVNSILVLRGCKPSGSDVRHTRLPNMASFHQSIIFQIIFTRGVSHAVRGGTCPIGQVLEECYSGSQLRSKLSFHRNYSAADQENIRTIKLALKNVVHGRIRYLRMRIRFRFLQRKTRGEKR